MINLIFVDLSDLNDLSLFWNKSHIPKCSQIGSCNINIVRIGQDRARFISQMMKYEGKLFHKSSHTLSCQFDRVFCNTRTKLSFLLHRKGLRMLCCCAGYVFELVFAYLVIFSHKYGKW